MDEHLRRTATAKVDNRNLQIAYNSRKNEYRSEIEIFASPFKTCHNVGANGVHDVANHRNSSHDAYGLVHKVEIVGGNVFAREHACLFVDSHVVAAFGECQKQSKQERHEHNPVRDEDACGKSADKNAQHETDRNDKHVDYGNLLEPQAVGDVHNEVDADNDGNFCPPFADEEDCGKRNSQTDCGKCPTESRAYSAGGYRTATFLGVTAVGFGALIC